MADTASLVVRVSATGVEDLSKKLDGVSSSATKADSSINTFTADATKSSTAAAKAGGAFSGFGSKAAQVGYQVQDMTVQLQAGTSAFTVIAQQVPQALGAFGPMGAIVGTVTALAAAVGGVLYKSLGDSSAKADDLKNAMKDLNGVITETDDGVNALTDRIIKLAQANEAAAKVEISLGMVKAKDVMNAASDSIEKATKAADGWTNSSGSMAAATSELDNLQKITQRFGITSIEAFDGNIPAAFIDQIDSLSVYMNTLGKEYGLTKEQALSYIQAADTFNKQPTPENAAALASSLSSVVNSSQNATPELVKLAAQVGENARQMQNAEEKSDALRAAQENLTAAIQKSQQAINGSSTSLENWVVSLENQTKRGKELIQAQTQQLIKEIESREGLTDEQRKRALDAANKSGELELKELEDRENKKTETHAAALQKREDAAQRHREREAERDKQAAERFVAQVERTSSDELANIEATKAQRLAKLEEYHNKEITDNETGNKTKLISDEKYAQLQLDIEKTASENRLKEIDRRNAEILKKKTEHDQFMKEIQMNGNSAFDQIDAEANANRAKANELYQSGAIKSAEEHRAALAAIDKKAMDDKLSEYSSGMGDLSSNLKTALGEQNALYRTAASLQATINMYKSAQSSFAFGSEIGGPILGGAFAAVAVAAGLKNIAAINGAREQGGIMSAGSAYQMAERGKAEVIVPAGASRARTAAQMRDIMGQNSGGSQIRGVTIINNTTGRIDSAQTEVDNEDQLRVIIDEHVSNMLLTQDSRIAKARRASVGPGY